MRPRDPWRRFLERVLPWFDRDQYEREQAEVARKIALSREAAARSRRILAEVRRVERVIGSQR